MPPSCIATSRRRCSMARKRASMHEGPLAELFKATEAAQRQAEREGRAVPEETVEHVPDFAREAEADPEETERSGRRWLEPVPEQPARLHRAPRADGGAYIAVIRVVGVGGAGLNALDRMMDAGISQVEFIAVNTDIQQLQVSDAAMKLHIGRELTEGLGSGADPEVGRQAAEDAYDQ